MVFSQEKRLVLENIKSSFTKEIKENKRIKVWTTDEQKL
jgi:hypothetical protein